MYNDYRSPSREGWKYAYKGEDLARRAREKYAHFTAEERKGREELAALLKDENVRANDPKIEKLKQGIEFNANEREKCEVWAYEFARQPQAEYMLSLSDVVYFGLANPQTEPAPDDDYGL